MLDPLSIWGPSGLQTEVSLLTVFFGAGTTSRLFPGDALREWGPGMLGLLQDSEELSLSSLMTQLDLGSQNTCGPLRAGALWDARSERTSQALRACACPRSPSLARSLALSLSVNWLESSEFSLLPSISLSLSPSTWFDLLSSKELHATRVHFQQMWLTGLFLHETGHPTPLTAEVSINCWTLLPKRTMWASEWKAVHGPP